jgi:hypothetical protein
MPAIKDPVIYRDLAGGECPAVVTFVRNDGTVDIELILPGENYALTRIPFGTDPKERGQVTAKTCEHGHVNCSTCDNG